MGVGVSILFFFSIHTQTSPTLTHQHPVQEIKTVSQYESPIPQAVPADDTAISVATSLVFTSFPRIPTPPIPQEKPISPPPPPSLATSPTEQRASSSPEQTVTQIPESPPPYIVNHEKIREDLLSAIDERTIPALEEAIQQVKDHDYIQPLKYECERALELLNRL
ncbi:unnamed protein product, partial [Adineta steineri]